MPHAPIDGRRVARTALGALLIVPAVAPAGPPSPDARPVLLMPLTRLIEAEAVASPDGAAGGRAPAGLDAAGVLSAQGSRIRALLDTPGSGAMTAPPVPAPPATGASASRPAPPATAGTAPLSARPPEVAAVEPPELDLTRNEGLAGAVVRIFGPGGVATGVRVGDGARVLTTWHGLHGQDRVAVAFKQAGTVSADPGSLRTARVVAHSKFADLALLEVASPPAGYRVVALAADDSGVEGATLRTVACATDGTWQQGLAASARVRPDASWYSPRRVLHRADLIRADTSPTAPVLQGPLFDEREDLVGFGVRVRGGGDELVGVSVTTLRAFLAGSR